jgi:hypothetical protein
MEQGRPVADEAAVEVWDKDRDKAEAEWAARLQRGLAVNAYVRNVEQRLPTLPDSPAIN